MSVVPFFMQIAALICLFFAAFGLFPTSKVNWFPLGMALWLASLMVTLVLHPAGGIS